jgi:sodium transport system permease protein
MQIVGHGLVVLLLAAWMRSVVPPKALLGLGGIGLRGGLGAVAIGAGAWLGISLPAAWLTALMFPGQAEASEAFSAALDLSSTPLLALILALAIVPAIAEELLFRGAIYRLMTATSSARAAVVAQALVFGVFHGSIYRFLPTALLGLVLGELRRRTGSVVPGMIAHAMTNAIILLIDQRAPEDVTELLTAPTLWAFAGLALVALAHAVVDSRARSGVEVA